MPHLKAERRKELDVTPTAAKGPGDWNYIYFSSFCRVWSRKDKQSYATIHEIKRDSITPSIHDEIIEAESVMALLKVDNLDRRAAREEAYSEFRRLVAIPYENQKIRENGSAAEGVPYAINPAKASEVIEKALAPDLAAKVAEAVKVVKENKK